MCSACRLLFAGVAGASALQVQDPKRVLLFGSSVDRNSIEEFCGVNLKADDFLQTRWCQNATHNVMMGFIFHPGVGYNGDLHQPFHKSYTGGYRFHSQFYSTSRILFRHLNATSVAMLGGTPDLVVVESSLWDLAVWRQEDQTNIQRSRVRRWCQHDLPLLLELVKRVFPTSRIAFRTAPTIDDLGPKKLLEKFTAHEIDLLYDCITSSMEPKNNAIRLPRPQRGGFDSYDIVDFYALMKSLIDRRGGRSGLFMGDGYHPEKYPSMLYINDVLRRVGARPQDPPEPPKQLEKESTEHRQLTAQDEYEFWPF